MIAFFAGLFIGGTVGVVCMALCNAASQADDAMERMNKE